ncbi:titin-like isoform X2 [Pygocentrus nattereri]|uniref:titin-like isoform X2 n=1 Tax=Pygocentrus nattereri TaxID=42514 RepID=UPI0018910B63|nr:titin-like isoform X2 [Pygocentrus nattereri]
MWITEGLTDGKDLQRKVSEKRKMSMLVIFGVLVMFTGDAMGSLSMIPDCSFTQSDPCYGAVGHPLHLQLPFEYELNLRKNDSATHTLSRIFKVKHHRITKMPSDDQRWQFVSKNRTIIISSAEKRDSGKYFLDTFDFSGTSKGMYDLQLVIEENSPPTINLLEFGQSIMCVIEDFYPKPLSIKWKKDDREVRGRDWKTTENDSGSYRAVSVLEANLTSSSPGNKYTCEVTHGGRTYEKNLSPAAQFSLKINPPPAKELFINQRAVLECVLTGDNQKEVEGATVSWTVGGRSPATRDVRVGGVTQAGSAFTKTSTLTLEESVWFSGDEVICSTSVDQRTTSDKISVKRGANSPPTIRLVEFGQSIMCIIEDFYPKSLRIKWKKDDREVRGRDWKTTENDSGSYRAVSVLEANLGSSSPGTKYTCEVTHRGKKYSDNLSSRVQSSLKINPPPAKELFINQRAVLECVLTGDSRKEVEGATVSWTAGGRSPATRDVRVGGVTQAGSAFTKTSTLTLEESVWFSGTEVICSTSVDQRTTSDKISVKRGANSPPTIRLVEFGQSIMCIIEDFYPKSLRIKWKKDDREVRGRDWKTTENDSGSYRAVSVLEANLGSSSPGTKYTCEVTHRGKKYSDNLSSRVQSSLKINPPPAKELFINQRAVLECVLTGDSRKEVEGATVSWTAGGRSPATGDVRVGGVTQAGSAFTKTSTLTLEESVWFSGTEVICSTSVDQRTTSDKISVKRGGQRPSIVIYKPDKTVSDSDSVSLVCEVSSSDLANVYVMWKVNGGQYIEGNSMTTIKNDNTLIVLSYLTVTGQQYNSAEITCAVKDANIQNDLQPRTSSPSKTNSPPTIRLVEFGQSIMCIIEDFYPKSLRIKWKKDDREVRGRDWKTTENDSGSYRAVSVLEANLGSSSPGTKYTCEVTHRGKKYSDNLSSRVQSSLKINPPPAKELFINQRAVLECVLTGDSRKEVEGATVSWTAGGRSPATRDVRVGGVTQAGSAFTKTSTLTLEESVWFSGAEVICSTSRTSERISVKRGGQRPSIVIYKPDKPVSDSDSVSLVCEVSSSDLANVYVMWKVNSGQYIEGNSMTTIKNDNTLIVLSYLSVTGKQYNSAEITCAVKDANIQNDFQPRTSSPSISKVNCPICPVSDWR